MAAVAPEGQESRLLRSQPAKGSAIKTCVKCKVDYGDDLNFCPTCGSELLARHAGTGGIIGGAYRIFEPIGKGWAGVVYRAEHTMMGRPTALKVITSPLVSDPGFMERFRQAAHLLSDLRDPHIATVHDMGLELPNRVYVAMELVNGKSIASMIREGGPIGPQRVLDITRDLIKGLRAANVLGVVHGSVKPSNVMVLEDSPKVKILDFAARRIVASLSDESFTVDTPYGPVYGDTSYLAPEQVKGEAVDECGDVYNIGLVMYEMLTGAKPFRQASAGEIARAQVETVPKSPREFKRQLRIPKFMDKAVVRALAKDPDDRQASLTGLFDELQGEIISEEAPGPRRRTVIMPRPGKPTRPKAAPKSVPKRAATGKPIEKVWVPENEVGFKDEGPRLVRFKGKKISAVYPIEKQALLVGRSSECDITINDASMSRVHARITVKSGRYFVEDLGSLNGTYKNDDGIKRGHIEDGDQVSFGSVDLIFRAD